MRQRPSTQRSLLGYGICLGQAALVVMISACSAPVDLESAPPWQPPTSTTEPATTSVPDPDEPTPADAELLLQTLLGLTEEWNANALKFVAAYSDDEVGYEEFLGVAHDVQLAQASAIMTARVTISHLPSPLSEASDPVLDHYNDRLVLFGELIAAFVHGDDDEFERISGEYSELTGLNTLRPILEGLFTHPVIAPLFAAEGIDPQALVDAMVRTGS